MMFPRPTTNKKRVARASSRFLGGGGKKGNYIDEGAKKLSMSVAMGREDG